MKIKVYAPDSITYEVLNQSKHRVRELNFILTDLLNEKEMKELLNVLHSDKLEIDIKPYEEVSKIDKNE